jgi:hypothetical protein
MRRTCRRKEKKMEKSIKNNNIVFNLDSILSDTLKKSTYPVFYDKDLMKIKPLMHNLWIIVDKKIDKANAKSIVEKLLKKNFLKAIDLEKSINELLSSFKLRIAILPRNCLDTVLLDLKSYLQSYEVEFVFNEFYG